MKAIIPVAGVGTNLRPLTYTQPKPLIPVAGKPIISFILDQLIEFGINDFVFVIGYLGEKIKDYVERHYPDINKTFVTQEERRGSGHAIWTAREAIKDVDELIIFFGDTIVQMDMGQVIHSPCSCLAVSKVENPCNFGVVEYGSKNEVKRVVEKPKIPKSNMAMVGFYKIKEVGALLEGLEYNLNNDIRSGIEFPLTDGIMRMIEKGIAFNTVRVSNWFDCGKRDILLETNAILLDKEGYASQNLPPFENSIIIHPVSIGENCMITNSIIGPHVTIGDQARIDSAIIKNSIIGNYASIKEAVLMKSVIGNDTAITGIRQSLNIGDNTEIDFS
ncbi:MAG: glucose-1-phosphate thymidylyltransferase [Bacteroidetes bacterium]|nr:MAG: glucose-1-phosphate thymidylyltransferase [Bacteroidota bacterium]